VGATNGTAENPRAVLARLRKDPSVSMSGHGTKLADVEAALGHVMTALLRGEEEDAADLGDVFVQLSSLRDSMKRPITVESRDYALAGRFVRVLNSSVEADELGRKTAVEAARCSSGRTVVLSAIGARSLCPMFIYSGDRKRASLLPHAEEFPFSRQGPEAWAIFQREVVTSGEGGRTANPGVLRILHSEHYAVVPLFARDRPLAVLHVRLATESLEDRQKDILQILADTYSLVYGRIILEKRKRRQEEGFVDGLKIAALTSREEKNQMGTPPNSKAAYGVRLSRKPSVGRVRTGDPMKDVLPNVLTRREHEVLELLLEGQPNVRIAENLSISVDTVKTHVKKILRKLGAANRAEVIGQFTRLGQCTRPGCPGIGWIPGPALNVQRCRGICS
jgi:DNA-binding CsgD family transcriptional regulator